MPNFIKHIAMKVDNVDETRAFYENVFGYKHVNTVLRKGKNGDHVSHHMTDGYMDLTLIHYEAPGADERRAVGIGLRRAGSPARRSRSRAGLG